MSKEKEVKEIDKENTGPVFEVVVSNMGSVYKGGSIMTAQKIFVEKVEKSKAGFGQIGFENVRLTEDEKLISEYIHKLGDGRKE